MDLQKPVIIIGAGPVGLSLALTLAQKGVWVEVFEMLPQLSSEIRASTFHPKTLEMYAEWGVLDQLLANGQVVDRLLYWERSSRKQIAAFDYQAIAQDTPYPFRLQCPQSVLIRTLKPLVEALPTATVHMQHRLVSFQEGADGVQATFETPDGSRTVEGCFLCGADGSGSTVRKELGLTFTGMTYEDRFLLIASDLDLTPFFPQIGPVNYMYDPQEWVIILHLPDLVRIVFRLRREEEEGVASGETAVRERIARFVGEPVEFEIKSTSIYRVHQRVAETFRVGRTILLGDAAHINNPAGGMGMNSGIHDAHFLASRLARIIQEGASTALLDEYSDVRRQNALDNIRSFSDKNYADLSAQDEAYRRQRNEEFAKNGRYAPSRTRISVESIDAGRPNLSEKQKLFDK